MTTEEKAQALVDAVRSEYPFVADFHAVGIALSRAIEQHEAQAAEIERLKVQLSVESEPSPYCPICGSCGDEGCCGSKRCLYPAALQEQSK